MSKLPPRQIVLDFDACCVLNDWPFIGKEVEGCVHVLKRVIEAGHILILYTMRHEEMLDEAEAWFQERDIHITFTNCNPTQESGSRKVYGHLIIDDKCLGIPLIHDHTIHHKPFVDWNKVEKLLEEKGYL